MGRRESVTGVSYRQVYSIEVSTAAQHFDVRPAHASEDSKESKGDRGESESGGAVHSHQVLSAYETSFQRASIESLRKASHAYGLPVAQHRELLIRNLVSHLRSKRYNI